MVSMRFPTPTADPFRIWSSTTTTGTTMMRKSALPIHHSNIVASLALPSVLSTYCGSPASSGGLGLRPLRVLGLRMLRRQRFGLLREQRQNFGDRVQLPVQDRGAGTNQEHVPLDRSDDHPTHLTEGFGEGT